MSAPINDITGQRFGSRVAIAATDGRAANGAVLWAWRCDCGAEGAAQGAILRRHPSCPACSASAPHDIAGERFGRLVAVRRVGRNEFGLSLWECLCDCGRKRTVTLQMLRGKEHRSAVSCTRCKIKCIGCGKRVRKSIRTNDDATRCTRCVLLASKKRRASSVLGRVCRGCGRTDAETGWSGRTNECAACDRQACRHGRDADGRPLANGPRKVVAT